MNTQIMVSRLVQTIVDAPVWILLLLKITAILGLAWLVHLALFGANPRWRILLWRMTAAGLIALPAIVWMFPAMEIRVRPSPENEITANQGGSSQINALPNPPLAESLKFNATGEPGKLLFRSGSKQFAYDPGGTDAVGPARSSASQFTPLRDRSYPISWQNMLMAVWLGGVFILAMRACIGHYRIWQIARRAEQSPESLLNECGRVAGSIGCATPVEILQSEKIRSPLLCGLRRPLLLLPARMCEDTYRGDLPGIFAHELTHVRCHDLFWNAGLHIISILLWFHPLAWRLRKAHLAACELVCDAVSAGFVGDVSKYCRTLARVAVDVFSSHPAAGIAMARLSTISRRLNVLKKKVFNVPLRRRSVLGFGFIILSVVAVLGVLQFALASPPADESAPTTIKPIETPAKSPGSAAKRAEKETPPTENAAASDMTSSMQVRVVDENGKPIAGAKVNTRYQGNKKIFIADADGKVAIEDSASYTNNLSLDIHAEGHVPVAWGWWGHLREPSLPKELTLTMEPAQTVGGVIQDEHGKPIQGVEVKLRCETDSGILLEMEPYSHTDSEGRWKYDYAPKKLGNINIVLQHPEFIDRGFIRPSALEIEKMANRSSLMIMKKGIVVTGTVTDPDGRPIANASVVQGMSRFGSFPPIMRTDKEGHYRLTLTDPDQEMAPLPMTRGDGFAYNANVLTVISPGFAPDLRQIDVKEGMPPVDFRLEKGGVIRIKAVDKAGKPVEGANISPDHWRNCRNLIDAGIAGKTDKDGLWTWTWAPKDAVEMSIKKTGYMSIFSYPLKPKETEQVVNLYPSLIISGRVIDAETKEPVKYFRVLRGGSFSPTNGDKTNIWLRVDFVEGINGLYNIVITEPGLLLRIEADGYKPEISREFKDDEGDVTCDFSLNKGKVLNVAVILPDGKPAAGANVQIVPTPPGKQVFGQPSVKNGRLLPSGFYEVLKVKADGQLPIEQQDGEFMLIVVHDQGYAQTTSRELMAHPEIKLEAWARVEGVIRQGGKPVPHLNIFVNENRSYDLKTICNFDDSSETDAEGKFLFSKLRPGKWFITGDNGRFGTVDLAPGQTLKRDFNAP